MIWMRDLARGAAVVVTPFHETRPVITCLRTTNEDKRGMSYSPTQRHLGLELKALLGLGPLRDLAQRLLLRLRTLYVSCTKAMKVWVNHECCVAH